MKTFSTWKDHHPGTKKLTWNYRVFSSHPGSCWLKYHQKAVGKFQFLCIFEIFVFCTEGSTAGLVNVAHQFVCGYGEITLGT